MNYIKQVLEHFNKYNEKDRIEVKHIKDMLDSYIEYVADDVKKQNKQIEIEAVKSFVGAIIEFDHFSDYDLRFLEQRLCDFIARN